MADLSQTLSGLNDLYGQYQSQQTAQNTNNQVNSALGTQQGLYNNQANLYTNQINGLNQNYNDLYNLQAGLTLGNIDQLQQQSNNTSALQNGALGLLGDQRAGLNDWMKQLQGQMGNSTQQGQDWLSGGLNALQEQRGGYQSDIDRQLEGMSWLTDMDSPVMQMARQSLERQDAAAGRRSQWGDREVELAAKMMENYGKYAPGLQQGIQASRNAMSSDVGLAGNLYNTFVNDPAKINQSLQSLMLGGYGQQTRDLQAFGDIYNTLGQGQDRTNALLSQQIGGMGNLAQLLQNQGGLVNQAIGGLGSAAQGLGNAANNANTTGRQAANSATNQQNQLLNSGLSQLAKLFGGSGGDASSSISGLSNMMGQLGNGLGDWSSALTNDWFGGGGTTGGLGFDLDSLFGNDTVGLGDGLGYDYGGTSGGILDFMNNYANSGGGSLWDNIDW